MRRTAAKLRNGLRVLSIAEIAFDVGFHDLSYFSRSFRTRFGVSAKEYRIGGEAAPRDGLAGMETCGT
jgi:AraC-like DNA-binding protein